MYEYKFIKVALSVGFMTKKPKDDYHAIIKEQAKSGWRLVQIFAPPISGYGHAKFYELIFERPTNR